MSPRLLAPLVVVCALICVLVCAGGVTAIWVWCSPSAPAELDPQQADRRPPVLRR